MSGRPPILEVATALVRSLQEHGHVAYFAGGCVRDRLLGIEPAEYDIATDAVPDKLKTLFPGSHLVGESFGVVLVRSRGHTFDIATFRSEGAYSDHRHPDEVTFCDAEEDSRRRDFTINGIFYDPIECTHIDYHGGRADLENRLLRSIGVARDRFEEDHLRMLRAVRFASRFGLAIDPETRDAIASNAGELKGVSRERIGNEIRRMAIEGDWAAAVQSMSELGLEEAVLGSATADADWIRCRHLQAASVAAAERHQASIAAWLLDRSRSGDGESLETAHLDEIGDRLVSSNNDRLRLADIIGIHGILEDSWGDLSVSSQKRLAVRHGFESATVLVEAVDSARAGRIRMRVQELSETGLQPEPLLGGHDLIQLGLKPGPHFSRMLDQVYDAQLEGRIGQRGEALELAGRLADEIDSES